MNCELRKMNANEAAIINRFLGTGFAGSAELRDQVAGALVCEIDSNHSLKFFKSGRPRASVRTRVPMQALAFNGKEPIYALLHVVDGCLDELEFYRADLQPLVTVAAAEDWQLGRFY